MKMIILAFAGFMVAGFASAPAHATDLTHYGSAYCEGLNCSIIVPVGDDSKADCQQALKGAYAALNRAGRLITNVVPCGDTAVQVRPGAPDVIVHTGHFNGRIDYQ